MANKDNYRIGGGKLIFNRTFTDGSKSGLKSLGNTPAFEIETEIETKPHYSSEGGAKAKDANAVTMISPTAKITLDEINADNLAHFFMATVKKIEQAAAEDTAVSITASQGLFYELGAMFIDPDPANITVTSDAGSTTYTYGADYLIEDKSGKIFIKEGGGITDATEIEVTFDTLAKTYYELSAFSEKTVEGELQFISNTAMGKNQILKMWKVGLTPASSIAFISEDYNTLEFECEIYNMAAEHPLFPFMQFVTE